MPAINYKSPHDFSRFKPATLAHLKSIAPLGEYFWLASQFKDKFPNYYYCRLLDDDLEYSRSSKIEGNSNGDRVIGTPQRNGLDFFSGLTSNGYEIYFQPNKLVGGVRKPHLTQIRAIATESDTGTIEEQQARIDSLGITPTAVVYSGGKSLHVFYAVHDCTTEQAERLTKAFAVALSGDLNALNTNRLLRLAGFNRGDRHQELLQSEDIKYTPAQLWEGLKKVLPYGLDATRYDQWKRAEEAHKAWWLTASPDEVYQKIEYSRKAVYREVSASIVRAQKGEVDTTLAYPLSMLLTNYQKNLLVTGISQGQRNSELYKLMTNALACEQYMDNRGLIYTESALGLCHEFASKCTPAINPGEVDAMYEREKSKSFTTSVAPDNLNYRLLRYVKSESYKEELKKYHARLAHLDFPTTVLDQKFLPDGILTDIISGEGGITAIKSIPGSGKTHQTRLMMPLFFGKKTFNIFTYRNSLGIQFAKETSNPDENFFVDHKWGRIVEGVLVPWSQEVIVANTARVENLIIACIESCRYFPEKNVLILEESEKVIKTLLTSPTCHTERTDLIEHFIRLLNAATHIICLDADLSAISLRWLAKVTGKPVKVFDNRYQTGTGWLTHLYPGSISKEGNIDQRRPTALEADLIAGLMDGKNYALATDSQKGARALMIKLVSTGVLTKEDILICDSDETKDRTPKVEAFMASPNNYLEANKVRLLIYTPTIESSLSIDIKGKFDAVFGIFVGSIDAWSIRQMLSRVRQNVPRFVHCVPYSNLDGGIANRQANPDEIIKNMEADIKGQLLDINSRGQDTTDLPETIDYKKHTIRAYAEFKSRENFSKNNLQNHLVELLEDCNHVVVLVVLAEDYISPMLTESKKEWCETRSTIITEAPVKEYDAAQAFNKMPESRLIDKFILSRAYYQKQLPGLELTPELIYRFEFEKGLTPLQRRAWIKYPDEVEALDLAYIKAFFRNAKGEIYDLKTRVHLLKFSRAVNLPELLERWTSEDFMWSNSCEEITKFRDSILANKSLQFSLKCALSISVTKSTSPSQLIISLVERFGYKTKSFKRTKNSAVRYYQAVEQPNDKEIMEALIARILGDEQEESEQSILEDLLKGRLKAMHSDLLSELADLVDDNEGRLLLRNQQTVVSVVKDYDTLTVYCPWHKRLQQEWSSEATKDKIKAHFGVLNLVVTDEEDELAEYRIFA